jgi:hypothetical protein
MRVFGVTFECYLQRNRWGKRKYMRGGRRRRSEGDEEGTVRPTDYRNKKKDWEVSVTILKTYIPLTLYLRRGSRGISNIPSRHPRFTKMRNTADVTGAKPIAVLLQSISGVSAVMHLVAFYDIHGGKREVLFFYFVLDTTRDQLYYKQT